MSFATLARKSESEAPSTIRALTRNASNGLRISDANSAFEREADRAADEVMTKETPRIDWSLSKMSIMPPEREHPGLVQPKHVPPIVGQVLNSRGRPLDQDTRNFFERSFGHNFSAVRVHSDDRAAESARAVNALAYTVGNDIALGSGKFAPRSIEGRHFLAHELAHVVQQGLAAPAAEDLAISNDAAEEQQAKAAAVRRGHEFASGPTSSFALNPAPRMCVQRQVADKESGSVEKDLSRKIHEAAAHATQKAHEKGLDKLRDHVPTSPQQSRAPGVPPVTLSLELHELISGATWKEIRKRVYPKESAAGIKRATQRKSGALADLTGLGSIKSLESFATAIRDVQKNWGKTPNERLKSVGKVANVQLTAAEVPGFKAVDKEKMTAKAAFSPPQWKFLVNEELVNQTSLANAEAGDLANSALHESRHAEQQFLAARYAAGAMKQDPNTIAATQTIPLEIAKAAVGKKFDSATDPAVEALGTRMYKATVVDRASNQATSDAATDSIHQLDAKRKVAETAVKALDSGETPQTIAKALDSRDALRSQIASVEKAYTGYRNIPYEADAHEVGDAEEQAFKGWP